MTNGNYKNTSSRDKETCSPWLSFIEELYELIYDVQNSDVILEY